jgi:hypothetical protein
VGGACCMPAWERPAYRVLGRHSEGKGPFGIHKYRWEDNIEIHLQEMGCHNLDCTYLVQDRDQ